VKTILEGGYLRWTPSKRRDEGLEGEDKKVLRSDKWSSDRGKTRGEVRRVITRIRVLQMGEGREEDGPVGT